MVSCVCLGLFVVLCWVWVSFASFPDDQLTLEDLDALDRGAFQPQSALSEMEFAAISSYRGPGNSDRRSNKELPILLWWSGGLFPHFPGDTERIDCATSSCLVTSNRKVLKRYFTLAQTEGRCTLIAHINDNNNLKLFLPVILCLILKRCSCTNGQHPSSFMGQTSGHMRPHSRVSGTRPGLCSTKSHP